MFSGIIEAVEPVMNLVEKDRTLKIDVRRPPAFTDIQIGDSISVNGTCLTIENFSDDRMMFSIGLETLLILKLNLADLELPHFSLREHPVNLERSLRYGDRVHGHYVTGHVDHLARIIETRMEGACCILKLELPATNLVWTKGSITVHGVSLTVNTVTRTDGSQSGSFITGPKVIELCLIPETLVRTNLSQFKVGDHLNIELDWMAKGLLEGRREYSPTPSKSHDQEKGPL